jgi:predicted metalloendopeptidase
MYQNSNDCKIIVFHQLNGITTLGENMADYGGIREAFVAYRNYIAANGVEPPLPGLEKFTSEQIFFINFANTHCGVETSEKLLNQIMNDPHSPSRYRVIGTLSNSEDFVREFHCSPDTPMNQLNKCLLWR